MNISQMKKPFTAFVGVLLFGSLLFFTGCATIRTLDTAAITSIDISATDAHEELASIEKTLKGEAIDKPFIIKVPQGFNLPVHLTLDTPLLSMENRTGTLVFKQDLFLYVSNREILVSPDKLSWVEINNLDAVKELFGGEKGELSVGMSASKEQGPLLDIKAAVHPKQ